jgi:hypothetical protein
MSVFVNMSMLGLDRHVRLWGMGKLDYSWGRGKVFYVTPVIALQWVAWGGSKTWVFWVALGWWYWEVGN